MPASSDCWPGCQLVAEEPEMHRALGKLEGALEGLRREIEGHAYSSAEAHQALGKKVDAVNMRVGLMDDRLIKVESFAERSEPIITNTGNRIQRRIGMKTLVVGFWSIVAGGVGAVAATLSDIKSWF